MSIEESDEFDFGPLKSIKRQRAVLRKYSAGAEQRINSANSKSEALRIASGISRHFDQTCESSVLRAGLRQYLADLVRRSWGEQ